MNLKKKTNSKLKPKLYGKLMVCTTSYSEPIRLSSAASLQPLQQAKENC